MNWCRCEDLNPEPSLYERAALPLELHRRKQGIVLLRIAEGEGSDESPVGDVSQWQISRDTLSGESSGRRAVVNYGKVSETLLPVNGRG
jgi:hypothetical protein